MLKRAARTLREGAPVLIVEVLDQQLRAIGTSEEEVSWLRARGYEPSGKTFLDVVFTKTANLDVPQSEVDGP